MKYARMNNYVEVHNQCALNKYTKHRVNMLGLDNFTTSERYFNLNDIDLFQISTIVMYKKILKFKAIAQVIVFNLCMK